MRTTVMLAVLLGSAGAQGADLLQVYRDAAGFDAQFASARAQLEATRERIPQARAGLLPAVSLGANANYNDQDTSTVGKREYGSNAYTLQLTQPVYRRQNNVTLDQARLQVTQAEAQFAQARQDLILRVTQAYFDVLLAQDTLSVLEAQKKATFEQLEQAKRNFEVGTSTITDSHEAQARYDLVLAQEIAARNDLEVRRHALRQIIGREPEALAPLRPDVQIQRPQPDDMQQWVDSSEKNAYVVQAQQAAADIAALEIQRARYGHHPTVDLVASHGMSHSGTAVSIGADITTNTIGLQLNLPIYAGGAVVSRERESAALRDRALADLENARRTSALSARQSYLGVTGGMAQVRALEQALVSSQSALESNRLGYEVGVRINIDVLNAQQQVFATRRDLARSKYETLINQLRLRSAVGALGEEDVQAVNALLQK